MIAAVLFDLDDTLFAQERWLTGAWWAVARQAVALGLDDDALLGALVAEAGDGTDRGHIIDRALERIGAGGAPVDALVAAFHAHVPERLAPYPGVRDALDRLGRRVPLGLVSDGEPGVQRAKLAALGLDTHFAVVVLSDELGREHRKPDPLPFVTALSALGVDAAEAVFVGDRPAKDIVGAHAAGLRAVRVRTGEYAAQPDRPRPWASVGNVPAAVAFLCGAWPRGTRVGEGWRPDMLGPAGAVHPASASR